MQHFAVIPAAGKGIRAGYAVPKQYLTVHGRTIIEHSIQALLDVPEIKIVMVVLARDDIYWDSVPLADHPKILTARGGSERQESVLNGLLALQSQAEAQEQDWVLVHDAARPCLHPDDARQLITVLAEHPVGGVLGTPVKDTLKRCTSEGQIQETVSRQNLWHALTPQMFRYQILLQALQAAVSAQQIVTDESSAIELTGAIPHIVPGSADNIKVTTPEDLALVKHYFESKKNESGSRV
jgi:2-C-methyl-D-erythritol 4-phosphate cytidylyltransferase